MKEFNISKAYSLVLEKIQYWAESIVVMLPNLIVAILVLLGFYMLAKGVRLISKKVTNKISNNIALNRLVGTILFILVLGIGIFTALSVLKLDRALTSLLTGAGIIGLALSFAFQDSASNFISGVFMALRKPLNIGDIVETDGVMGEVKEMSLRNTVLLSFQGQYVFIPNKDVYQNKLINYSELGRRRVDIEVGVSYGDKLDSVKQIIIEAINHFEFILDRPNVSFVFTEFGASSVNGKLMFWIEYEAEVGYLEARDKAMIAIKQAFDKNDIMIPYPIRTLDFGIKGGEKLSAILQEKNLKTQ